MCCFGPGRVRKELFLLYLGSHYDVQCFDLDNKGRCSFWLYFSFILTIYTWIGAGGAGLINVICNYSLYLGDDLSDIQH